MSSFTSTSIASSETAASILTKLLTVDGTGSLLDSDKVDGQEGSYYLNWGNFTSVPTVLTNLGGLTITTGKVPYGSGSSTFGVADSTSYGRSLWNAADASAAKTLLGIDPGSGYDGSSILGALITVDGVGSGLDTDLVQGVTPSADALTMLAHTFSQMRTDLSLVPGTDVQAYDAELAAIAGLTSAADSLPYFTGSGTASLATFTTFGRSLVDDADASTARTTLGVVIGTNVQAYSAALASIAGLTTSANKGIYTTGSNTYATYDLSAFGLSLVDDADASAARTTLGLGTSATVNTGTSGATIPLLSAANTWSLDQTFTTAPVFTDASGTRTALGLAIGTNVQAYDAELAALAGLTSAADSLPYFTGSGTASIATFTSFGRSLVDDADATAARTTLGLGTAAVLNTGTSGTNIPLLDGNNTWSSTQTINNASGVSTVTIGATSSAFAAILNLRSAAGSNRTIQWYTDTTLRFAFFVNSTAEGGSNAGSNANFRAYDDAGTSLGDVFTVTRSSRVLNFVVAPTFTDASTTRTNLGLGTSATVNTGTSGATIPLLSAANTWTTTQTFTAAPVFTDASGTRTALGVVIGTDVQAYSAALASIAGLTTSANKGIYTTASNTYATYDLSAFGLSLVDDADATAARTTLGLGTSATVNTGTSGATIPLLNVANTWGANQTFSTSSAASTLQIGNAAAFGANLNIRNASGQTRIISFLTGSTARFSLITNNTTEGGSNAGSNFAFRAYDDAGTSLGDVWTVTRSSRVLDFTVAPTFTDASTTRTNLGLAIGTNVQAYDAELAALAGLTSAADSLPYFTGSGTASLATFTTFGRSLVDDADATAARTTLGLGTSATVNTGTSGATIPLLSTANTWTLAQTFTAAPVFTDASGTRTALGLVIGTNVQAYDAELAALAGLTSAADSLPYFTGSGTAALATFTTFGRSLVDDADATAGRSTLGLGTSATVNTGTSGATIPLLNGANTWSTTQTFTVAPVFTDASGSRTALGLGTSATINTGTSGATIPLLSTANTWTLAQTFSVGPVINVLPTGTAVASAATASTVATRDSSGNLTGNILLSGYATTATAAGTTTLTVASAQYQYFTGSTTQTVTLPVASTLSLGLTFTVVNNSSGVVTVQSSGANTILALPAGVSADFTCILTSGTGTGSWNSYAYSVNNANTTSWAAITRASGFDTFVATPSGANLATLLTSALPVSKGGTNATSAGITAFNNITGYTAAGATGTTSTNLVFSTSPTLVTPVLGAATATSINGLTITSSTGTLSITNLKTLSVSNSMTLTATDGSTLAIGAGGTLASAAYVATGTSGATIPLLSTANTWTTTQTFTAAPVFTDASGSRTALGLAIGTNVQAYDAELSALAGLTSAADSLPYFTGSGTASLATFTSFGRSLVDDADATAGRTTLGLGTAAVQAIGTSGANVPLLSTANTWTLAQTFSAGPVINVLPTGTAVASAATASTLVTRDSSANLLANIMLSGYATTATAAGTTTLTVASAQYQYFTGSTTQTVTLPVASTLSLGLTFTVVNNSSGVVTVQSSGANTVLAMAAGTTADFTCILTSGTNAASWNAYAYGVYNANTTSWASVTRAANFDTFVATPSGANLASLLTSALPVSKGGTNATSAGITAFNNITGYTATGATGTTSTNLVFSTSPTLVTPVLGAATATSINGLTITSSTGTLTITNLKTLSVSNSLTLTATDGSTLAIGAGGTLGSAAYQSTGTSGANIPFLNGANTWSTTQTFTVAPVFTDASGSRTALGLTIGTNVQAYDAELAALAGLTSAADSLPYFTGSGTAALATFTTFGRSLVDDADATAARTTLGLASSATVAIGTSGATIPLLSTANTWTLAQTFSAGPVINALPTGTAVASAATASTVATRDSSGNLLANILLSGYTTTATAAGTTTLTVASSQYQYFTGSTTQTVTLPVTSTLSLGLTFTVVNNSSGVVTVQSSGANTVLAMAAGATATFTCILTSGTSAASWSVSGYGPYSASTVSWALVSRASGFDTFAGAPTGANLATLLTSALPVSKGGTNATSAGIAAFNNITGYTAAGATGTTSTNLVFSTSPTLVTPVLGAATATSINGLTITSSTGTFTLTNAKTLAVSNSMTLTATDGSTLAIGAGGTLASAAYVATGTSGTTIPLLDAANTWTLLQTYSAGIKTTATGAATHITIERTGASASTGTIANSGSQFTFDYNGGGYTWQTAAASRMTLASSGLTSLVATTVSTSGTGALLTVVSSDAGATAHGIDIFRNSASPAASDAIGNITFTGRNSTPATVTYSSIGTVITDATAASEDGTLTISNRIAGSLNSSLALGTDASFTFPTDSLVQSIGTSGYGAFFAKGSGTNSAYLFLGNVTNAERSRIYADNSRNLIMSNDGGSTAHFTMTSAGAVTLTSSATATNFTATSDESLKTNVLDFVAAAEKLRQMRPVTFDWKKDGAASIGFIAQEMEKVLPQVVLTNPDTNIKSINYGAISSALVGGWQEHDDRIEKLEKLLEQQAEVIAALLKRVA